VVNFDRDTTERELERAFERYGRIQRCQIKKTYAFVQFNSDTDAADAMKAMDGAKFHGRTLKVEFGLNDEAKRFASGADDRPGDMPRR
jgi:RNA recognition motif-containing protein